jgi:hypothetical protein
LSISEISAWKRKPQASSICAMTSAGDWDSMCQLTFHCSFSARRFAASVRERSASP